MLMMVVVLMIDNSGWSEVQSESGFDWHFLFGKRCEHFLMYYLAIWTSSSEKFLFSLSAHFFLGSLIFWEFSFLSSL
jgi:hypothetical protein